MSLEIYQSASVHPEEAARERAVEASGALDATDDPGLLAIVTEARKAFQTSMAAISIVYRDWQYLIAADGVAAGPYSRRTSFCGHAILSPARVLCVPDARADARFAGNPAVAESQLVRFYMSASLVNTEGLPLGALCVFDPKPRACESSAEQQQLLSLAQDAMRRLERLRQDRADPQPPTAMPGPRPQAAR